MYQIWTWVFRRAEKCKDARNQLSKAETFALVSEIILFTGTSTLPFHVDITLTHSFSREWELFSLSLNFNKLERLR